jgi:hypothetical protein
MSSRTTHKKEPGRSSWGALKPRPKVAASGSAGAATILIVFIAGELGLDVPPEAAAALTTLLSFAAGWVKKDKRNV